MSEIENNGEDYLIQNHITDIVGLRVTCLHLDDIKEIPCKVNPIESVEFPTPAQRPPFSLMNKKSCVNAALSLD